MSKTPSESRKPEGWSRYRKIEVRMWGDEKFRALSPLPPCGQALWVYLLTGPHTGPLPGLFRSGRAAMAEELDWEMEAFDKAFAEALEQGMVKADWKAKLVWIPKAIECNKPASANVVLSWAAQWDLMPECALKDEAFMSLKASIYALGESYQKAFDKAFLKTSPKPLVKPSRKAIDNQEQEQEQDINTPPTPRNRGKTDPLGFADMWAEYPKRLGGNSRADAAKAWGARLRDGDTVEDLSAGLRRYAAFLKSKGKIGTEFVKTASTFFGPGGHFRESYGQAESSGSAGDFWTAAGFEDEADAVNNGCTRFTAQHFRDGKRVSP